MAECRGDVVKATSRPKAGGKRFIHRARCDICQRSDPVILFGEDFGSGDTWAFLRDYYAGRLDRQAVAGTPYEILLCKGCGFIWQSYVLTGSWSDTLYQHWISPEESLAKECKVGARARTVRASQISLIPYLLKARDAQDIRVLDFGMGWGSWCLMAKASGFQTYGVEVSRSRIAHAEANGIEVIRDMSQCHVSLDFMNAEQVFEHVPAPMEVLRILVDRLQPDGLVRIGVPDGRRFLKRLCRGAWMPAKDEVHPLEHVNCFTRRTLIRLAVETGLEPIAPRRMLGATLSQLVFGSKSLYGATANLYTQLFGTGIIFEKKRGAGSRRG